jgi:hypothetical protein
LQYYFNLEAEKKRDNGWLPLQSNGTALAWALLQLQCSSVAVCEGKKKHFRGYESRKPGPNFIWNAIQSVSSLLACLLNIPSHPIDRGGELFSMVNKCSGKVICSAYNLGDLLASSALSRQRLQWLTQPYPFPSYSLPPTANPSVHP